MAYSMSQHSSQERIETIADNAEALEIIREEHSPALSSVNINDVSKTTSENHPQTACTDCACAQELEKFKNNLNPDEIEKILQEKEQSMRCEFDKRLQEEADRFKERFDFILHNEQVRASYMLREAHRERQEKIRALQTQLECKNLAGLMYVMCTERRKSKLEKLRLVEEYTNYIRALQQILSDGQELILHLSRGYKTAARVDQEWREKMTKIIKEFQAYVIHFSGGSPESNQYIFDLPTLLTTNAPIRDNPAEDPIEKLEEEEESTPVEDSSEDRPWWDLMEGDCRPFVMFGDMAEFRPPQRREVLKTVKAAKTAPKKWKEYVFNEMFLRADCSNADAIKDEYPHRYSSGTRWECQAIQTEWQPSRTSVCSRRVTAASIDARGNMGSILKIISSNTAQQPNKTVLLAARDSMEIASTTKLREKQYRRSSEQSRVKINIGSRVTSVVEQFEDLEDESQSNEQENNKEVPNEATDAEEQEEEEEKEEDESLSVHDSLQVLPSRVREKDHKIHYEKVCPMEKCQRMQVDSFMRSLPPYMRASPFTHFEQTYQDYETCSPGQLEILKRRIEDHKSKSKVHMEVEESPLDEWKEEVEGVGVQTSEMSLPPCTCKVPSPTPVSSVGRIFNMEDLIPIKQTLNEIRRECFYDGGIEFDRFKVIGQGSKDTMPREDFHKTRLYEIKRILKSHPSLCEIFQANTRC